jgi:hypothetical protein
MASIAVLALAPANAASHHAKHAVVRTEDDPLYLENYPAYVERYHDHYADQDDSYYSSYPYDPYLPPSGYGQGTNYRGMSGAHIIIAPRFVRR